MSSCIVCGKTIPNDEGFFTEAGLDYCEKCYADKRWAEMAPRERAAWAKTIRDAWYPWIREAPDSEERMRRRELVKRLKVPASLEAEVDAACL